MGGARALLIRVAAGPCSTHIRDVYYGENDGGGPKLGARLLLGSSSSSFVNVSAVIGPIIY